MYKYDFNILGVCCTDYGICDYICYIILLDIYFLTNINHSFLFSDNAKLNCSGWEATHAFRTIFSN